MSWAAYDNSIKEAIDALTAVVEDAEAAGLTVICRQTEVIMEGDTSLTMNSFEVYKRLL
jgi:hypothetical protein